jgi:ubiquitin-conjugating enzyme E2 variant
MSATLLFAGDVIACVLLADFLSGFFHWLEDAYGQADWPITGRLITQPNILHHSNPRHFLKNSWLNSAQELLAMGGLTLLLSYWLGCLNWMTWLVVLIGVNANEFHKWAHRTQAENGKLITFLQKIGLLQSPAHHACHHRGGKNTHYCVVTNCLNPILDAIHLWSFFEWIVFQICGAKRRLDVTVVGKAQ